jgi:hypothetical protein
MMKYEDYRTKHTSIIEVLNNFLKFEKLRARLSFLEFLEISNYSFDGFNEGVKPKEGYVLKQSNIRKSTSILRCICACFICCCKKWQMRWFVLKDDMICYLDNSSASIGKDVHIYNKRRYFGLIKKSFYIKITKV